LPSRKFTWFRRAVNVIADAMLRNIQFFSFFAFGLKARRQSGVWFEGDGALLSSATF